MRRTLLASALLLACAQAPSPSPVVAEAGDVKITAADISKIIAAANPDVRAKLATNPALLERLVRTQLVQALLLNEAHEKQWDSKPNIAFLAQQARDTAIANSYLASLVSIPADYPSDADVQAAFDAQKGRLMLPKQYHLAQIFIAVPQNAPANLDADTKKRITMLRQQLIKPHADFASAARKESDDKASAQSGGDLGWMADDRLRPPVREAVLTLQPGVISEPLRMEDGWHLVTLLGTKPAAPATLADVRPQLVQALRKQKMADAEREVMENLLKRDPIRLNEIELQKVAKP
jgi:parvulin-like peptidyl-prolyl isomerase